ncbi:MAG TPA: dTMP kinase [Nitrospiria bacterium]|nr:dTMP kinase [Nitrospiria bacterium]
MRGFFITFEGIEGSGKSTQIEILAHHLLREGHKVVTTREPGGTAFGEQIRRVLLSIKNRRLDTRAELFLYLASRTQHLEEVILPALKKGTIVLCDRFSDATLAYQGFGRRLDMNIVRAAVDYAAKGLIPDLTLLLDLDVGVGLNRVRDRGRSNRMDREQREFHQRVRAGYRRLARTEPGRIKIVEASQTPEDVAKDVKMMVDRRLVRRPVAKQNERGFHVVRSRF